MTIGQIFKPRDFVFFIHYLNVNYSLARELGSTKITEIGTAVQYG